MAHDLTLPSEWGLCQPERALRMAEGGWEWYDGLVINIQIMDRVQTPDGIGTVVEIIVKKRFCASYIYDCDQEPTVEITVWYGTNASQNGWTARRYSGHDITHLPKTTT